MRTKTSKTAAMGNKKTSVLDKKGNERYPKCVMYQYHEKAAAYNVLDNKNASRLLPRISGSKKNWTPSVVENVTKGIVREGNVGEQLYRVPKHHGVHDHTTQQTPTTSFLLSLFIIVTHSLTQKTKEWKEGIAVNIKCIQPLHTLFDMTVGLMDTKMTVGQFPSNSSHNSTGH